MTLTTDNGALNDNVFAGTLWDDDADPGSPVPYGATNPNIVTDHTYTNLVAATPLSPEEPLSAFVGENPNGVWTLTVVDDASADTGTLQSWSLQTTTQQCIADLKTSVTDTPDPVRAGGSLAYDVTVANQGTLAASNVSFSTALPANVRFASVAPSTGGTCTAPAVNATGTVTCTWAGSTAAAASRTARIVVIPWMVGTLSASVTGTSATTDTVTGNNSATATTTVIGSATRAANGARCTIIGDNLRNVLTGTTGKDVICGLGGKDSLSGLGNNDVVDGGSGNDFVNGGAGADRLYGGSGNDAVNGGSGNDFLSGGAGRDRLGGGAGRDFLTGGLGLDVLAGGAGFDTGVRGGDVLIGIERRL